MAVPVAALAKIAAAVLSDEDTRRKLGWIVAAICSPLILTLALICSLLSGSAEHNNSAVLLCFNGGNIPGKTPAEYVAYIEDMRRSFTLLDSAIDAVNDMTEDSDSLDGIRVKAVFYALYFGEDTHGLIGSGVYASHGYERSHVDGVKNTFELLKAYLG